MKGLTHRTIRKYKNEGLESTISAGWEIIYRKILIRRYVIPYLLKHSPYTILRRQELLDDNNYSIHELETVTDCPVTVPPKKWVPRGNPFEDMDQYKLGKTYYSVIPDAILLGPVGLGIKDNRFIGDSIGPPSLLDNMLEVVISRIIATHGFRRTYNSLHRTNYLNRELPKFKAATPLVPLWQNYYHWIAEALPRLRAVEKYREKTGRDPVILVPSNFPQWAKESVELMGFDLSECVKFESVAYRVEKLILPSYPEPTPGECHWIRKKARQTINPSGNANRIYISRRNATRRRVVNENEVKEMLNSHGFSFYALEEEPVKKQAEIFSNAEIIVGPHGAGFVNMIFSDDPNIIELFGDRLRTTFYRLAKILDFEYDFIKGETEGVDIRIDVEELEKQVKKLLN